MIDRRVERERHRGRNKENVREDQKPAATKRQRARRKTEKEALILRFKRE